jgi:hypothetical protein
MKPRFVVMVGRTPEQLAQHEEAKRLIGDLIMAAKAACPFVPECVGSLPIGRDLTRAVENVQAFLAVSGEEY